AGAPPRITLRSTAEHRCFARTTVAASPQGRNFWPSKTMNGSFEGEVGAHPLAQLLASAMEDLDQAGARLGRRWIPCGVRLGGSIRIGISRSQSNRRSSSSKKH